MIGCVILTEAVNSVVACAAGLEIASPPSHSGSA